MADMKNNKFEKILNIMNIPLEVLISNYDLEEAEVYRFLSGGSKDKTILDKISHALSISKKDLLNDKDIILQSVFSSFNQPFYIFRLIALEEIKNFDIQEYLSFIPNHCTLNLILIEGLIKFKDVNKKKIYIKEESFTINDRKVPLTCDLAEGTVILIYIHYNADHLLA